MKKAQVIEKSVPTSTALLLAIIMTGLSVLNQTTFKFGLPWSQLVTGGLAALAALGVSPLASSQIRNLLHITYQAALTIAAALTALATWLTTVHGLSTTWRPILIGLVTAVAALISGPASAQSLVSAVTAPPPQPPTPPPPTPASTD
jgi:hypothetical protein